MENGKLTYRVLSGIIIIILAFNIFNLFALVAMSAFYIPSRTDMWLLILSTVISIVFALYIKKNASINYIKKSLLFLIVLLILFLPAFYSYIKKPLILPYVLKYQEEHCFKTGEESHPGIYEYKCNNGDLIYKADNNPDHKLLFDGGKSKAHFPFWLIY